MLPLRTHAPTILKIGVQEPTQVLSLPDPLSYLKFLANEEKVNSYKAIIDRRKTAARTLQTAMGDLLKGAEGLDAIPLTIAGEERAAPVESRVQTTHDHFQSS